MRRFLASPEAKGLDDRQSYEFVMDYAADYFGATIATLRPSELRRIIFEIVPRKLSIEASAASAIIAENRAFYAFLKRAFGLEQADACLRVFAGDAARKLEAELSNPGNFGMAKSLFMAGREAGFDMDTQEGIERWMGELQSKPLPDSIRLPSPDDAPSRAAHRTPSHERKTRRKAKRNPRRKNR